MTAWLLLAFVPVLVGGFFADAGDQWIARRRLARRGVHVARDLDAIALLQRIRDDERAD